jgi:hypothetical protein
MLHNNGNNLILMFKNRSKCHFIFSCTVYGLPVFDDLLVELFLDYIFSAMHPSSYLSPSHVSMLPHPRNV